ENAANLSIRGFGSPLVVVDGIPGRSFDELDPDEIATITILKDAASAAVYGVSGGNGVILVTTKKGISGKPQFDYSFHYGLHQDTSYIEFVNSPDYVVLVNEASSNVRGALIYTPQYIEKYRKGNDARYANLAYYSYVIRDYAPQIMQDVHIRGGS